MRLTEAHTRLKRLSPAFTTREAAGALNLDPRHASVLLGRLSDAEHLTRLGQGRWGFREHLHPFGLPEALTRPTPSYVSLQSALYHHGMIEQIPDVVYAVSLGPTRRIMTPLGTVSLHRVSVEFFFGFEHVASVGANIAAPEKALLDFLYLRPARSRMFRMLPELELPRTFDIKRARSILRRIRSERRRTLVERLFDATIARDDP